MGGGTRRLPFLPVVHTNHRFPCSPPKTHQPSLSINVRTYQPAHTRSIHLLPIAFLPIAVAHAHLIQRRRSLLPNLLYISLTIPSHFARTIYVDFASFLRHPFFFLRIQDASDLRRIECVVSTRLSNSQVSLCVFLFCLRRLLLPPFSFTFQVCHILNASYRFRWGTFICAPYFVSVIASWTVCASGMGTYCVVSRAVHVHSMLLSSLPFTQCRTYDSVAIHILPSSLLSGSRQPTLF